ncbi:MAG: DUF2497 domain-containing protein, partial [Rhodospirillales bacterium]
GAGVWGLAGPGAACAARCSAGLPSPSSEMIRRMSDATSQEPSMEEILASIRRIISEEGDGKPAAPQAPAAPAAVPARAQTQAPAQDRRAAPAAPPRPAAPRPAAPAPRGSDDDVLELSPAPRPAQAYSPLVPPIAPPQHRPQAAQDRRPSPSTGSDELMSESASNAASAAFAALSGAGAGFAPGLPPLPMGEGARTLEEMVRDTLRPLLKAWLDQNLPPLVERMVRIEIERLSRRS